MNFFLMRVRHHFLLQIFEFIKARVSFIASNRRNVFITFSEVNFISFSKSDFLKSFILGQKVIWFIFIRCRALRFICKSKVIKSIFKGEFRFIFSSLDFYIIGSNRWIIFIGWIKWIKSVRCSHRNIFDFGFLNDFLSIAWWRVG